MDGSSHEVGADDDVDDDSDVDDYDDDDDDNGESEAVTSNCWSCYTFVQQHFNLRDRTDQIQAPASLQEFQMRINIVLF